MKTDYDKAKDLLVNKVESRERSNRYRALAYLLFENHKGLREKVTSVMEPQVFQSLLKEAISLNRTILRVQQMEKELRGKDYNEKDEWMYKKQIELGYRYDPSQDIRTNQKLL